MYMCSTNSVILPMTSPALPLPIHALLCRLAKLVSPPAVVRQIDWIERHWPNSLPEDCSLSRPQVGGRGLLVSVHRGLPMLCEWFSLSPLSVARCRSTV